MTKHKIVEVLWDDSNCKARWHKASEDKAETPSHIMSIGYLASNTRKVVVIRQSLDDDGFSDNALVIPKSVVKKFTVLAVVDDMKSRRQSER